MAKKKTKKKPAKKKTVKRKQAAKKSASKKSKNATKKKPAKKSAAKKTARKKTKAKKKTAKKKTKRKKSSPLGRPKVTGEEKLFLLFKGDYHARQIFDFLDVETVKELEQFSAEEITKLLSRPIRTTVNGIRQALAEKNRHLAGDEEYALQQKQKRASS